MLNLFEHFVLILAYFGWLINTEMTALIRAHLTTITLINKF